MGYGHYELLGLLFGLTNASVFMNLMNRIFMEFLNRFIIIFIDVVFIYSLDFEIYVHLRMVLETLVHISYMRRFQSVIFC